MVNTHHLYACVYVAQFPLQALLRLRPELSTSPVVVMEGERPWESVCSCNEMATTLGVLAGMSRAEIELISNLKILSRSLLEESSSKNALLSCMSLFSPRVEEHASHSGCAFVVDLQGMKTLFGSPQAIGTQMQQQSLLLGLTTQVAISANFYTALSMCHPGQPANAFIYIPFGEEQTYLATLPISVILTQKSHLETFSLWGINSVGDLAHLLKNSLIARVGQEGGRLHELAHGKCSHHFQPTEIPMVFQEVLQLDDTIEALDSLLFVLNRMLEQIVHRVESQTLAIRSLTITLSLENLTDHQRVVRATIPTTDRKLLLKLLQLDLLAHPAGSGIKTIHLVAEPGQHERVQLGLFSPQFPDVLQLDVTLARIAALVGEKHVGTAILDDSHQPEAFSIGRFTLPSVHITVAVPGSSFSIARQLRPPVTVTATIETDRILSFSYKGTQYDVKQSYGPWEKNGEWWAKKIWTQETWDVVAVSDRGTVLICNILCNRTQNQWVVQSVYD